jgi:hypothetical protein
VSVSPEKAAVRRRRSPGRHEAARAGYHARRWRRCGRDPPAWRTAVTEGERVGRPGAEEGEGSGPTAEEGEGATPARSGAIGVSWGLPGIYTEHSKHHIMTCKKMWGSFCKMAGCESPGSSDTRRAGSSSDAITSDRLIYRI